MRGQILQRAELRFGGINLRLYLCRQGGSGWIISEHWRRNEYRGAVDEVARAVIQKPIVFD